MASSPSESYSEGEIVETNKLDKATTSLVETKDISVDPHSRKRVSISRSPSPYCSNRRPKYRGPPRSPYRESRGSKRAADDDHYEVRGNDPRRFKVRYEDQSHDGRVPQHASKRELYQQRNAIDRNQSFEALGTDGRPHDGYRKRNRSPAESYRRRVGNNHANSWKDHYPEDGSRPRVDINGYDESRSKLSNQQSVRARNEILFDTIQSKPDAEIKRLQKQQKQHDVAQSCQSSVDEDQSPRANAEIVESMNEEPLDEATLIEARRKRREAIKAKHKGQTTPLLVQALAIDKSAPSTPKATLFADESPAPASPQVSHPSSPKATQDRDSTIEISVTKDFDLANTSITVDNTAQADEPSAADYDPTMDMQEDKMRQAHQQHNVAEIPAVNYDENANVHQDVLLPQSQAPEASAPKAGDDFDMFGDDNEFDMFAEAPITAPKVGKDSTKAIPIPQAKTVDMSMLDDCDDPDGYYKVILGEVLDSRYLVQSNLGKGMFSGVVRATDQKTKRLVAIKLARNNEAMRKTGFKEIGILEKLMASDPEDKKHIIRLERYFEHKGHLCMVFENLSIDLREVLKKFGRDVGINLKAVREYARQMFLGLSLLRKCNVLHADLKPDNILVNEARSTLKICDLGSASDTSENEITQYLVSRFYRAPEIILGLPYDFAIDMWSVGCTLFELYTGKILFTGRSNNQMLRAIMECRGKFSHKLLRKGEFAALHFDDLLNFRSLEKDRVSGKDTVRILNFSKPTRDLKMRLMANVRGMGETEAKELTLFMDLLDRCLNLNPEKRCTPNEALKHPFILRTNK